MARAKITEYKSKKLLFNALGIDSNIISFNLVLDLPSKLQVLDTNKRYVIKVDQGVKGRYKKDLIKLDKKPSEILSIIKNFEKKGYSSFIIEEYFPHNLSDEVYFSIERTREGKRIYYSKHGGVNIEDNKEETEKFILHNDKDIIKIKSSLGLNIEYVKKILKVFDNFYLSFLEINPLVINRQGIHILDLAVEVDTTAEFFVQNAWNLSDFVSEVKMKTKEEEEVLMLSQKSQAAFKLDLINPNGKIFMLLSGGGASIVLADEVQTQGFDKDLANYGEYSGNPSEEETYIYTNNLLSLLLKSSAKKKVLIIGGGVANFTDIRITFKGIIRAFSERSNELKKQDLKVFVRRGGPHQKEGLDLMKKYLESENLFGEVAGPDMVLTDIVILALKFLKHD